MGCISFGLAGIDGLAEKANVVKELGVTNLQAAGDIRVFIDAARGGKIWERERP
jgi:hypothetical protein